MTITFRLLKALLPLLALSVSGPQAATPRYNFKDHFYYSSYPYGSIQLPQPLEYCFNSFSRYGALNDTPAISYNLVPVVPVPYGTPMDIFVGFRLLSQPDKLWLLSRGYEWNDKQWVEYVPGGTPVAYGGGLLPGPSVNFNGRLLLFLPDRYSKVPGIPDLTPLIGDGELLVGYGLRANANATAADAYREMLDNGRFAAVWQVGEAASPNEICLSYDRISTHDSASGVQFANPDLKPSIPPQAGHPATPASGYPLGEVQLVKSSQYCNGSAFSGIGALDRVTRLDYTLLPAEIAHLGKAVDVFLAYWDWNQPDRLWLLERGTPPTFVEYTPDSAPVAFFGDNPVTLDVRNVLTLIDAPESAPIDMKTPLWHGSLVLGYGLRNETNGSVAASFQEMLASKRFGIIMRLTTPMVQYCFDYSTIRVRDISVPNNP